MDDQSPRVILAFGGPAVLTHPIPPAPQAGDPAVQEAQRLAEHQGSTTNFLWPCPRPPAHRL